MRLNCDYAIMRFLISSFILSYGFSIFIIETNSSWLITESIKTLEYKTFVLFNLDFANNTTLLEFLFYFIDFYLLIAAVIAQIFNQVTELIIPLGIPTKEANAEMETHIVIVEPKIRSCSI